MNIDEHSSDEPQTEHDASGEPARLKGDRWFDELVLSSKTTGLPFDRTVLLSGKGGGSFSSENAIVTVWRDTSDRDAIRVAIHPEVRLMEGELTAEELRGLRDWIELNRETIESYWTGGIAFTEDALKRIRPLDDSDEPEDDRGFGAAILGGIDMGLPFYRVVIWMEV